MFVSAADRKKITEIVVFYSSEQNLFISSNKYFHKNREKTRSVCVCVCFSFGFCIRLINEWVDGNLLESFKN